MPNINVEFTSSAQVLHSFNYIVDTKFTIYLEIFTDGSKMTDPIMAFSAAIVVPSLGTVSSWKLPRQYKVFYAIKKLCYG